MERVIRSLLSPWFLGAMFILSMAGTIQTYIRIETINQQNVLLRTPEKINPTEATQPILIFARALEQQNHGDPLEAIRLYGTLLQQDDRRFLAQIRYNLGTLYLHEAAKLWKNQGLLQYARINTLLAAAKENLRESLTLEPDQWDARYNLEYAYRITPPPKERSKEDFQGSKGSVFATLPAIPGGGP